MEINEKGYREFLKHFYEFEEHVRARVRLAGLHLFGRPVDLAPDWIDDEYVRVEIPATCGCCAPGTEVITLDIIWADDVEAAAKKRKEEWDRAKEERERKAEEERARQKEALLAEAAAEFIGVPVDEVMKMREKRAQEAQ